MQRIFNEYIEHLTLQNKETKNPKFSLKLLFNCLDDNDLDFTRIKIQQAQDFQTYLVTKTNKKGQIYYSKRSVGTIVGSITAFYDYLAKRKIVYANPFLEIKKLRSPKILPKNILNEEKTDRLLKSLREFQKGKDLIEKKALYKAHVVSELMYSTGARINEIAKLRVDDVDFIRGVVRITDSKSRQTREAVLNEYAGKVLRIFVEEMRGAINFNKNNADTNLLFGAKTNLKIWLNAILNRRSKKLKFGKYSSHYIRHSVGAHLLKNGCDIRFIQEILGHKRLSSTQVYTQIEKEDLRNVIDKYHPRCFGKTDEKQ
jgi:integrase/recombinase XerD